MKIKIYKNTPKNCENKSVGEVSKINNIPNAIRNDICNMKYQLRDMKKQCKKHMGLSLSPSAQQSRETVCRRTYKINRPLKAW